MDSEEMISGCCFLNVQLVHQVYRKQDERFLYFILNVLLATGSSPAVGIKEVA